MTCSEALGIISAGTHMNKKEYCDWLVGLADGITREGRATDIGVVWLACYGRSSRWT